MVLESKDGGSGRGSAGSEDVGISRREHLCRWHPAVDRNNQERVPLSNRKLDACISLELSVRILTLNIFFKIQFLSISNNFSTFIKACFSKIMV